MCVQLDCSQSSILPCDCQDYMLWSPLQTSTETTEGDTSGGESQDENIFIYPLIQRYTQPNEEGPPPPRPLPPPLD